MNTIATAAGVAPSSPNPNLQPKQTAKEVIAANVFDMVTNLISEKKIPALDELRMEALLHHLFTATPRAVGIQVAEVVYRYDYDHKRGSRIGRPRSYANGDQIRALRAQGVPWRVIAKQLGIGTGTAVRAAQ